MELKTTSIDPLKVLTSTKEVMDSARFVKINYDRLPSLTQKIKERIDNGLESASLSFGSSGDYERDVQLIFIEDVVNFCFWEEKSKEKWFVEWKGKKIRGGWYALEACFERAITNNVPILDAEYLKSFGKYEAESFFKSSNGIEIPLVEKRIENLREAGNILAKKYNGQFVNVLKEAEFDAVKLVHLIADNFPSFRDIFELDKKKVYFLKRAQIVTFDIGYLNKNNFEKNLKNIDQLTAFADYKIPQMLRMFEILEYSEELAEKVDNYVLIPSGSREEIEIRSACIWGIEMIRQLLGEKYSAGEVDNALWLISQKLSDKTKPYHRTYSIYY